MVSETRQDPERIYLEPAPYSPEGRLWCATDAQSNVWSIIRSALSRAWALSRPWAVAGRPQVTSEVVARLDAIAAECEREVLTALRSEAQGEESVLSAARLFVQQARAAGEDRFSDFGVFSAYEGLANAVDAAHPTNRSESDE